MSRIENQKYWSVQRTQDGRGWDEIFQVRKIYTKESAWKVAQTEEIDMESYPQFYRIVEKSRKVLI